MRKLIAWAMAVALLAGCLANMPATLAAGATFAGGNGSAEDPYRIRTEAQLYAIRDNPAAQYRLEADIELREDWIPVPIFSGTFDGQGYTIRNLTVRETDAAGFVAKGEGCVIRDVVFADPSLAGIASCGVVAGTLAEASVTNVRIENGTVTGQVAGGVCGSFHPDSIIRACTVSAQIVGSVAAGGITGNACSAKQASPQGIIEGCEVRGSVRAEQYAGGIIGSQVPGETLLVLLDNAALATVGARYAGGISGDAAEGGLMVRCSWLHGERAVGTSEDNGGAFRIGSAYNTLIPLGGEIRLQPIYAREELALQPLTSSDGTVVQVLADGRLRGNKAGKAVITSEVSIAGATYRVQDVVTVTETFAGGSGTPEDPYTVRSYAQLQGLMEAPYAHFSLEQNLDLGQGWTPLGSLEAPFAGTLSGGHHTLVNLNGIGEAGGLFGACVGATIENLALEQVQIEGAGAVGGIADMMIGGELNGCTALGTVRATGAESRAGLLVGEACFVVLRDCGGIGAAYAAQAAVLVGSDRYVKMENCYWYGSPNRALGSESEEGSARITLDLGKLTVGQTLASYDAVGTATNEPPQTNARIFGEPTSIRFLSSSDAVVAKVEEGTLQALAAGEAELLVRIGYSNGRSLRVAYPIAVESLLEPVPAVPGGLKAASTGYDSLKLSWSKAQRAEGYELYRATVRDGVYSLVRSVTDTGYADSRLTTGLTYYYKIRSYRTSEGKRLYSAFSAPVAGKPIPSTPGGVSAVSVDYRTAKIAWKAVAGADRYQVYRAASKNGSYQLVRTVTGTSYQHEGLTAGRTYYYKVRCYRFVGEGRAYSSFSSPVAVKAVPQAPAKVAAASTAYNSVKISWGKVSGASRYQVYRATSKNGSYQLVRTVTGTSYQHTGLTVGRTYYYKVRCYRIVGDGRAYSAFTNPISVKPVPAKPTKLKAAASQYNSLKLSWAKVTGAHRYQVYRATSKNGAYKLIRTVKGTAYTDTGLTTGKTYYYKVRCYRLSGTARTYSGFCSPVSGKPVPGLAKVTLGNHKSGTHISWTKVQGASAYRVYRSVYPEGPYTLVTQTSKLAAVDQKAYRGVKYYYRVRAYRNVSGKKIYGPYSAAKAYRRK